MNVHSPILSSDARHTVLGIDPGLAETGWGVILVDDQQGIMQYCASGSISTKANAVLSTRLQTICSEIRRVIDLYQPSLVAIEQVFLNRNPESTMKLCHGRAAAMLAAAEAGFAVQEFHNRQIKSAVVGKGNAQKEQMSAMIRFLLPNIDTQNEHALDALCVAVCAQQNRQAQATLQAKVQQA